MSIDDDVQIRLGWEAGEWNDCGMQRRESAGVQCGVGETSVWAWACLVRATKTCGKDGVAKLLKVTKAKQSTTTHTARRVHLVRRDAQAHYRTLQPAFHSRFSTVRSPQSHARPPPATADPLDPRVLPSHGVVSNRVCGVVLGPTCAHTTPSLSATGHSTSSSPCPSRARQARAARAAAWSAAPRAPPQTPRTPPPSSSAPP